MIPGSIYVLRGQPVTVLAAWNGARNPQLPELQARYPLVHTGRTAPRNVMLRLPGGTVQVRPFRGLRRIGAAR